MTCETYRDLLDRSFLEQLSDEENRAMREHEAACPACLALRRELTDLDADLKALSKDVPPVPEDFHAQWMGAVQALSAAESEERSHSDKQPSNPFRHPMTLRMVSAAAVLVLVAGASIATLRSPLFRSLNMEQTVSSTVEDPASDAGSLSALSSGEWAANMDFAADEEEPLEMEAADQDDDMTLVVTESLPDSEESFPAMNSLSFSMMSADSTCAEEAQEDWEESAEQEADMAAGSAVPLEPSEQQGFEAKKSVASDSPIILTCGTHAYTPDLERILDLCLKLCDGFEADSRTGTDGLHHATITLILSPADYDTLLQALTESDLTGTLTMPDMQAASRAVSSEDMLITAFPASTASLALTLLVDELP